MLKLSKLRKGFGHVVEQQITEHNGDLKGSVFSWRARKDSYQPEIPTSLSIPFDSWELAGQYAERCHEQEFQVSIRRAKRTRAVCEVKILFPMKFSTRQAVECLEACELHTFLPF